jgi:hypothetical protein
MSLVATPESVIVPEGQSSVTFPIVTGATALIAPTSLKLYVSDGVYSRAANLKLTPIVKLSTFSVNAVEGGFSTVGSLILNIPAQSGGAVVTLTSGDPSLVNVPASVSVPQYNTGIGFNVTTASVTDPNGPPLGTMQFEQGVWKGSMMMDTAPAFATVWNSNGGQATLAVTIKTPKSSGGGGGSSSGGGGGKTP